MTPEASAHIRVLIGIPDPKSLGGPAACEPSFIAELRRQGVTVEEDIYVYGDKLSKTSSSQRVKRVLASAFRLRASLRQQRFDLVHLNSSFDRRAILRDVPTVKLLGAETKIFIKFHGSDAELLRTPDPLLKSFVQRLLKRVDGIGLLSQEEKANFVGSGWPAEKMFVVKNVVERDFPTADSEFNAQYGFSASLPVLLFIGRFIPAKGLLDVITACGLLRDKGIDCGLICVGDGPARLSAEEKVQSLSLADRVRFTGFLPESQTAQFYANCSTLVFPTYHYEGFPMTIFYAAAAGLPIITTRIRAAADYLTEPDNCFWTEPQNPGLLAEKIEQLLGNPGRRQQMSGANKQLSINFRAEPVTREYLAIYRKIIGEKGPSA